MEGSSGGTALVLVTLLLAQFKSRGIVDLDQIQQALMLLVDREITPEQMADARNALAVVEGLQGMPSAPDRGGED